MSLAVYCKQLYRVIASNGYNNVNIPGTLDHIRLLFEQIECPALELKQKYNIIGALESMLLLYKYQENENNSFQENINSILDKVQQLAVLGDKNQNYDTIKSALMLTESVFSINSPWVQE